MNISGRGTYTSYISKYEISKNQDAKMEYIGPDPRNETTFIINDMNSSLDSLDETLMKKKVVRNLQELKKKKNMVKNVGGFYVFV